MAISLIAAVNESFAMGDYRTNDLLYKISDDLTRFKNLTTGNYVVMGKNTYNSLSSLLSNRTNVILTKNTSFTIPSELHNKYDVIIEHDLEKVLNLYKSSGTQTKELYLIGGSHIYAEGIHWCDKIHLTMVHEKKENLSYIYFPSQELSEFTEVKREKKYDEKSGLYYSFIDYVRKGSVDGKDH